MTTQPARTWESAEAAEIWRQSAARRAQTVALATDRMFLAAGLQPGMHVLDIAAGTGDQSVLAARIVGPSGSILATDISATMLAAAAQAAKDAGLTNIETRVADASALEAPEGHFDAAICRFGLMFVPDLHAALVRIRAALKPGARFAALVWSTEERNPWLAIQLDTLRAVNRPPDPNTSLLRALSLSAPGRVETSFVEAGFADVEVSAVPTPRELESVAEAVEAIKSSSPTQGELYRSFSEEERARYEDELTRRTSRYADVAGPVSIPGEALLISGRR